MKAISIDHNVPAAIRRAGCGSFVFQNGHKGSDFVVYNPFDIQLKDEPLPTLNEIKLKDNDFWNNIKSLTWSSSCRFFFVINETHIIVGNTMNNDAFLCTSLSWRIFEEYLNAFRKRN